MDQTAQNKPLKSVVIDADKIALLIEAHGVPKRELARLTGFSSAYVFLILKERKISARRAEILWNVLQEISRTRPLARLSFLKEESTAPVPIPSPAPITEITRPPGAEAVA